MKKTIFMAALGMSVLAFNAAQAADFAPYVGLKTGISHVVNKAHSLPEQDDNLWFGSIALGADFREMDVNSNYYWNSNIHTAPASANTVPAVPISAARVSL